jgi:hypothetical protein
MILYNTLIGVAAGLALILVPMLARKLYKREVVSAEGWSLTFAILGVILTVLGGLTAITWPLTANPPINIMFGEPTFMLGLLLLAAAFFMWRRRDVIAALSGPARPAEEARSYLLRTLAPVSWLLFALGLVLLACTIATVRFNLVGSAPAAEPITGLLHDYPIVENTFFAVLYGLSAIALLLVPFAVRKPASSLPLIIGRCMMVAGVAFLLFSAMNYYTHIGLLLNLERGTMIRI